MMQVLDSHDVIGQGNSVRGIISITFLLLYTYALENVIASDVRHSSHDISPAM